MTFRSVMRELKESGWYEVRVNGSHHNLRSSCSKFVVTVPNHGSRDLTKGVIRDIERKTGLSLA